MKSHISFRLILLVYSLAKTIFKQKTRQALPMKSAIYFIIMHVITLNVPKIKWFNIFKRISFQTILMLEGLLPSTEHPWNFILLNENQFKQTALLSLAE